jgi:VWFA-related protein
MRLPWPVQAAALASSLSVFSAVPNGSGGDPSVRITSPLGRTGGIGAVRIVAQIQPAPGAEVGQVRFLVDGTLYKTDEDGPPYAVEWVDENPFERRELAVEVEDSLGNKARDVVVLPAFDVSEVAEVSSVLMEAGVYDPKGRFVNGLTARNFAVSEDGVPQTIDLVSHERVPATFALLIDSSQSMSRRFEFVKNAAGRLIDFLRPQDRVLVVPFSKQLSAVTGPTSDRRTITDAIQHIEAAGGTAILDALVELSTRLPPAEDRRAVILITDGYDEHSGTAFEDALAAVKAARMTVYTVGIGGVAGISLKGERELKRLAAETGGRAFFPPRAEELAGVYEQLAADAQNRYLVTYTPTNTAKDGAWRAVSLTTSEPDMVVHTRKGYRAPSPPPIRPILEFSAMDPAGEYVEISADDLIVLEDGVEQRVDTFHEAETPVSIVLAMDASGSMRKSVEEVLAAARSFVEALRPQDELAVLFFSDGVLMAHDLSTKRDLSLNAFNDYKAAGGTALYDAIGGALERLKRVETRRALVVMTDGRDENNPGTAPGSLRKLPDVVALTQEVDASILAIGLGANVDRDGLEHLAEISGGLAVFPSDAVELHEQFARTLENLRRRYVVGYTSTHVARDGSWRNVEIRTRAENIRIRSRSGYFAPDK